MGLPAFKTIALTTGGATNTVSNSITNGGTATAQIDTVGFDYACIDTMFGPMNTTSNAPTLITLGEADVTNTSSATNALTQFSFGTALSTSVAAVIPVTGVNTAGFNVFRQNVDLRMRKRYLLVSASPITTCVVAVHVALSRAEGIPVAAGTDNVQAVLEG